MQEEQQTALENNGEETEDNYFEKQTRCGILGCYPSFLQPLASKKMYVLIFGLLGTVNHAIGSYEGATLTTIEKRFKISSKTSGIIGCFWDVGTILSSVSIAYLGGRGHKPRWVALGMFVSGIASFAQLLPHVIYGAGEDAIEAASYSNRDNNTIDTLSICRQGLLRTENCAEDSLTTMPRNIMIMSNFMMGVGTCVYWTLGVAFLDDNTKKDKVALLLSISVFLRLLGPVFGKLLASYALKMYIDPKLTPKITPEDPQWLGAWWFGWLIFGFLTIILSLLLAMFPHQLPRAAEHKKTIYNKLHQRIDDATERSFKDFYEIMQRLLKNRILMYNIMSSVFYIFGMTPYFMFLPKYIETQFHMTASEASLLIGSVALTFTAIGVITSGAYISKFKPSSRALAAWNVFVEILAVVGGIGFVFISCSKGNFHGNWNSDGVWNLLEDCNSNCNCGLDVKYEPVCSMDQTMTYYSPCHAGCIHKSTVNGTKIYTNCSCIHDSGIATEFCPVECTNEFFLFFAIICAVNFFGSTGRAGNLIIQFRSVSPKDKSISIGFSELLYCALAFIPAPIFYGSLVDYTCQVWGHTCGETGNCWLYNDQSLRYFLNLTSSGFLTLAVLFDCGVWYHVKGLQIYDYDDDDDDTNKEEITMQQLNVAEESDRHAYLLTDLVKPTVNSNS